MSELKKRIIQYEGGKKPQIKNGSFRDGKYYPYLDSLSKPTIGIGHLMKRGDNYPNGLTEGEADQLLDRDIAIAKLSLESLKPGELPQDIEDYLILMIFQMGLAGVKKFVHLLEAAKAGDREGMKRESIDSLWYRQTPNRVNDMNKQLK